jgi:hypothetical protein
MFRRAEHEARRSVSHTTPWNASGIASSVAIARPTVATTMADGHRISGPLVAAINAAPPRNSHIGARPLSAWPGSPSSKYTASTARLWRRSSSGGAAARHVASTPPKKDSSSGRSSMTVWVPSEKAVAR